MKDSSCHDAKMEAYCNAVRRLEDKFDRLELNHIARKYNEEADELAEIASGQTTVPPNVFARDLTKPSVDFKNIAEATDATPEPSAAATAEPSAEDPLRSPMPPKSCGPAWATSSTPGRRISWLTLCRQSPSHGLSPCGDWTLSSHYRTHPGVSPTCW